ncbi:MAG: hypothetical protein ACREQN_19090, partial [Candidatus Binataceae bacterium]
MIEYCDGWIPPPLPGVNPAERVRDLREATEWARRPFDSLSLCACRVAPDERAVEDLIRAGFHRIVFGFRSASREAIHPGLETCAR